MVLCTKSTLSDETSCYACVVRVEDDMALITSHAAAQVSLNATAEVACENCAFDDRTPGAAFPPLALSLRDREAYFEAVLNPPPLSEHLRAAAQRFAELLNRQEADLSLPSR
jgi:hypothetical protein